ncbi:MAG: hypothetical protein CNIPEHKO_00956 [Anaerolineales bacterium]|nr:hypothetical protein [Anaerolineales bacterium]
MLSIDSDLGRHLILGKHILEQRVIPTHDLFSHTLTGESRPPYEWLSQVIFEIANQWLGLDGVILLTAILLSAVILLLYRHCFNRSQSVLISFLVVLIATGATSIHWLPRPHVITFLLLAIWIHNLEKFRTGKQIKIYFFPLLMLFWANLHGGFIFGFLAFAAYFAGWLWDKWRNRASMESGKKFFLAGIYSLAASIVTPDLWHNWEAVLNNRSSFILTRTVETMPPNLSDPSVAPFVILLLLTVFFSLVNWKSISAAHVFLLGGFAVLALMMTRNIPLFAIVCAPILSEWIIAQANQFPAWKRFDERFVNLATPSRSFLLPAILIILSVGIFAYSHAKGGQIYQFNPQVFPVQAADWLEENPIEGNMFNEFNWGGYLLYRLWPRNLVFVDSQSDFYGEPLMRDYETMMYAKNNWRDLLNQYQITWAIIPSNAPLANQLEQEIGWTVLYEDPVAVIIQRK